MPIITLTTDFGLRDSYVAQMKGVLLASSGSATLVDLSHEIEPQNVRSAARFLKACVPRFPPGTIHLAVIDPGVGSERRALAGELAGQRIVGPDNGVFSLLFDGSERLVSLRGASAGAAAASSTLSSTFHGRDVFAPAAAALAAGSDLASLGEPVTDPERLRVATAKIDGQVLQGEVEHIDRFGNLITNIERSQLARLCPPDAATIVLDGRVIGQLRDHYAQVGHGSLLALVGSDGTIEVAARDASAAAITGASVGAQVMATEGEVAQLPLDGELDLHTFRPAEVADVVRSFVRACHEAGLHELRIVHGKGKGTLRRTVHKVLEGLPEVERFALAPAERGGWGATLVDLKQVSA